MKKAIIVVIGALALLLPVANAAPSRAPRLAITDLSPFTVYGSGFASNERVKLTVDVKARVVRSVVANAKGAFTARFATVRIEKCSSYVVRAAGAAGSAVTKKVLAECPTPENATGDEPPALYPNDPTPKKK